MNNGVLYTTRSVGKSGETVSGGFEIDETEAFYASRLWDTGKSE